ncbi:MAG: hypothetical protein L3V56_09010 [Candidatus Magnetoovum sp. WYHC-5]|nr:hypothetical protein [Candidatus Magnetoovum sp. WYHC-5]
MNSTYTAIIKQDGDWWIGWIEEMPGVNCQESTKTGATYNTKDNAKRSFRI